MPSVVLSVFNQIFTYSVTVVIQLLIYHVSICLFGIFNLQWVYQNVTIIVVREDL